MDRQTFVDWINIHINGCEASYEVWCVCDAAGMRKAKRQHEDYWLYADEAKYAGMEIVGPVVDVVQSPIADEGCLNDINRSLASRGLPVFQWVNPEAYELKHRFPDDREPEVLQEPYHFILVNDGERHLIRIHDSVPPMFWVVGSCR